MGRFTSALCIAALVGGVEPACIQHVDREVTTDVATVDHDTAFLKIHMRDGDLYVLSEWQVDEAHGVISGKGVQYGADRQAVPGGPSYRIDKANIALFETNKIVSSPTILGLAVVTGISIAVTVVCLVNSKSCFGSCPTFYAPDESGTPILQAEGFSDAISPALETHDIDALWRTHTSGGPFVLTMTNEAYETHVVKQANVLAVPKPSGPRGGRVLSTGEQLWLATAVVEPITCDAAEGSCLDLVRAVDGRERTSLTDEHDLAARETIDLTFPKLESTHAGMGVVIGSRQTLVTTFLLYQGLAYLGETATTWLAALDSGGSLMSRLGGRKLQNLVGGIDVQIEDNGEWRTVGEAYETGPLATDVHLVRLPDGVTGERVRLSLPKGGWRVDYVALAALGGEATPQVIAPRAIAGTLGREFAAGREPASAFPIITLPGDTYRFDYDLPRLPDGQEYELFLDSRGYYLEWMRKEWLREQNPLAALKMLINPAQAMRDLAPAFKQIEPRAEEVFWRSRYAHP